MYTFDEIAIKYNLEKRDNPRESIQRFESYARSHGVYLQWIVGKSKPRKYEILNNPEECFTQTQLIEKYGLENKVENISIVHSPKVRLRDIISPYIWPVGICTTLVFVYAMIRYRKLGAFRTLGKYIVGVLGIELLYLSLIALTRLPINQLVIPVGLLLYTLAIIIVTVKREIKLEKLDKVEN